MEKINIAELLKDCPKGMELDCAVYNDVTFLRIDEVQNRCYFKAGPADTFWTTCEGRINGSSFGKCVIFPKGKTTWEGFVPPCKFKDGDIVSTINGKWIGIVKKPLECTYETYITVHNETTVYMDNVFHFDRLATEEEKQKLFDAIKDNGYKWNAETKTLVKLTEQKFDITTLKPFDKVLVRDTTDDFWIVAHFSHYGKRADYPYYASGSCFEQCIPYEQNEHLLGTTIDCDEYYKTWG